MTTTSTLTHQRPASDSPVYRSARTNPWQRVVAMVTLVPALIAAGMFVAALMNHEKNGSALVELSGALLALEAAGLLAVLWVLIGAINWQIKEAARGRG